MIMSDDPTSLVGRLWAKITIGRRDECWLWNAGVSRSGRREVDYGLLRHGRPSKRRWRAHRLVLILSTGVMEVLRDADESEDDWLNRCERWYRHLEASHTCDTSLCCNPAHLEWLSHTDNVKEQAKRRKQAA